MRVWDFEVRKELHAVVAMIGEALRTADAHARDATARPVARGSARCL